ARSFHLEVELADQRAPFGRLAVDVGGVLRGRRGELIAALVADARLHVGARHDTAIRPKPCSVAHAGARTTPKRCRTQCVVSSLRKGPPSGNAAKSRNTLPNRQPHRCDNSRRSNSLRSNSSKLSRRRKTTKRAPRASPMRSRRITIILIG